MTKLCEHLPERSPYNKSNEIFYATDCNTNSTSYSYWLSAINGGWESCVRLREIAAVTYTIIFLLSIAYAHVCMHVCVLRLVRSKEMAAPFCSCRLTTQLRLRSLLSVDQSQVRSRETATFSYTNLL